MALSRLLVVALAVIVSPFGAAVCEIACGTPVHAATHDAPASSAAVAADSHQHHHQAASEVVTAASGPAPVRLEARPQAACDPVTSVPARIRGAFSETPALTHSGLGASASWTTVVSPCHPAAASPPSSPPHHAPVPLRI